MSLIKKIFGPKRRPDPAPSAEAVPQPRPAVDETLLQRFLDQQSRPPTVSRWPEPLVRPKLAVEGIRYPGPLRPKAPDCNT